MNGTSEIAFQSKLVTTKLLPMQFLITLWFIPPEKRVRFWKKSLTAYVPLHVQNLTEQQLATTLWFYITISFDQTKYMLCYVEYSNVLFTCRETTLHIERPKYLHCKKYFHKKLCSLLSQIFAHMMTASFYLVFTFIKRLSLKINKVKNTACAKKIKPIQIYHRAFFTRIPLAVKPPLCSSFGDFSSFLRFS